MKRSWITHPIIVIPVVLVMFVLGLCPSGSVMAEPSESASTEAQHYWGERQRNETTVRQFLAEKIVREKLVSMGLKPDEVNGRLNQLSDEQLQQLAMQIDKAKSGGFYEVVVFVVVVLLVVMLFSWLFWWGAPHRHYYYATPPPPPPAP